jgi:curved DNA-binding protein CbpA
MNLLLSVDRAIGQELARAAAARGSGVLTAVRGRLRRLFCVRDGSLVWATSNVIEEQFLRRLADRGVVAPAVIAGVQAEAGGGGSCLARRLVERGESSEPALQAALGEHVRTLLFTTLDWSQGEARFERGTPDLAQEITVDLAIPPLLLEYACTHPIPDGSVHARVGPPSGRPALRADRAGLLAGLPLDEPTRWVAERADGKRTAGELSERSPHAPERTWRAIYGLLLAGLADLDTGVRRSAADVAVTREEVLARLRRSEGADHYSLLELSSACTAEDIRSAYYFLARRYHPDRFRAGELADLLPRIEEFFTRVTEAYNTLWYPDSREAYDASRTEVAPKEVEQQDTRYLARQNFARARLLVERGRYSDAVTYLENAIQLDGMQSSYHYELGRLLGGNPRRREEAERHLIEASRLDPSQVDPYIALGQVYARTGRLADAARAFREALSWEPGHVDATERLAAAERGDEAAAGEGGLLVRG